MNKCFLLGDSVVKGIVFDEERGKYVILPKGCANLFAQITGTEVENNARFGCTVTKGVQWLSRKERDLSQYDCVILEFGGNDCDFDWKDISLAPDNEHSPNVTLDLFEVQYRKLIEQVRALGGKPVMLTLPPLNATNFFNWVTTGIDSQCVLKWLGDVERIYRWHELYNLAVCKIAATMAVPLIDIRGAFLKQSNAPSLICKDGMHPNESGHRLIAETLATYFKNQNDLLLEKC